MALQFTAWPIKKNLADIDRLYFNSFFIDMEMVKKIKAQSKLKFFKSSFICTILLWTIIIALIVWKNKVGSIYIFLVGIFWVAGMVLTYKAINASWTTLRKYNPQIKMDTEVRSLDEYFEIYSRAEHFGKRII